MRKIKRQKLFRGFSTAGAETDRNWTLYDIDLIKRDLANHFNTKVGERVMRPEYGCKIWDWLMEPLTPGLRDQITNEAVRICAADSRVEIANVTVTALDHGIRVALTLNYTPFAVVESFTLDFERRQSALFEDR